MDKRNDPRASHELNTKLLTTEIDFEAKLIGAKAQPKRSYATGCKSMNHTDLLLGPRKGLLHDSKEITQSAVLVQPITL